MLLNKSISYDVLIDDEKTGNETNYVEMLRGTNIYDPETSYLDKETADALYKNIKKNLSRFESEVFDAFVDGMTYVQIADKLGKTPKSIDNAIQRIKIKSEKYMDLNH